MLRACDNSYSRVTLIEIWGSFLFLRAILSMKLILRRSGVKMEVLGIVCLIALYKYLDSPARKEPIIIESYNEMTGENGL